MEKQSIGFLSSERKAKAVNEIVDYFNTERDEPIGILAAEEILDYFLNSVGSEIYKKGVKDAKNIVKQNFDNLEVDLELISN